jgi:hypothetical protein
MSFFAFIFIGGLILKGVLILIASSIDRLSLKYDAKVISLPLNAVHDDFAQRNQMETEVSSNSLKPLAKQIYMRTATQKTFSA